MKILFLTAEPPWPLDQGDKLRNYYLLKELSSKNDITLVCFCTPQDVSGAWQKELFPLCKDVYTIPLDRRTMLINIAKRPHMPITMAARICHPMVRLIRELSNRHKYDITMTCQLKMAAYLKYSVSGKKVAELTDLLSVYWKRMAEFESIRLKRYLLNLEIAKLVYWEKKIVSNSEMSIFVSPNDAAVIKQMLPDKRISVLSNGVNLEYFTPLKPSEKPVLIFYGHLRYPPNKDAIVWFGREIFPRIKDAVPEVELLIVGKEPVPTVTQMAEIPGVSLIGYVNDLRPYLERAALMIVPLRFGAGMRNKILEAMASERAVVSTSLGCEGLEVIPGTHLEVADEPLSFANAIIDLLNDRNRRAFLSENGRRLVESSYNWDSIGKRLGSLLRDI